MIYNVTQIRADHPESNSTTHLTPKEVWEAFPQIKDLTDMSILDAGMFEYRVVSELDLLHIKPAYTLSRDFSGQVIG